jgi:hypothetical protein
MSMSLTPTTSPAPAPAPAPSVTLPRTVTLTVRGVPVSVPCPDWCTVDHSGGLAFLEDLAHYGTGQALMVPAYGGGSERELVVRLAQWPFSEVEAERSPYLMLSSAAGTCTPLDATLAESVAAGLEAHAARLRAMSGQLARA